ncbi:ADP-ribosylglycohydrolase family protein [Micromonospora chokoriensis]
MSLPNEPLRRQRRVNSALWAAWADALGFITELAGEAMVSRRLAGRELDRPLHWVRRIGGRFGVEVELPAGTYSDDTQLRLSVGRCIRHTGFDAEAFAKVELPVWPTYALGGGRASKAAALNIASASVPWFANFFDGWHRAGGNGVAMRIQPHVWASRNPVSLDFTGDLIADAVITHGHPRALVGAVFHSSALAITLETGHVPIPSEWSSLLKLTSGAVSAIHERVEIEDFWLKGWAEATGQEWHGAWQSTVHEIELLLETASRFVEESANRPPTHDSYRTLARQLGGYARDTRGSGTVTSVLALALAAVENNDAAELLKLSALAVDTDTDTVATMAGALLGATLDEAPPSEILDQAYITAEAERLAALSMGVQERSSFSYPDLLRWSPPKSQSDAVGLVDGQPAIAGLGRFVRPLEQVGNKQSSAWSWGTTSFGQTLLVKHRMELPVLKESQIPSPVRAANVEPPDELARPSLKPRTDAVQVGANIASTRMDVSHVREGREVYFESRSTGHAGFGFGGARGRELDLDGVLQWIADRDFDDAAIGYSVRRICETGSLAQMASFTAALREQLRQSRLQARTRADAGSWSEDRLQVALALWGKVEAALRELVLTNSTRPTERKIMADWPVERLLDEARHSEILPSILLRDLRSLYRDRSRSLHSQGPLPVSYERRSKQVFDQLTTLTRQRRIEPDADAPPLF